MRRETVHILFSVVLTALFVQFGLLSAENNFLSNVVAALIIYFSSKILAHLFGGK